ncbi:hypothetical protein C1H46_038149 [Malus baccata]|uniref:Uncharacterized protein n=1 Tax=Malus baccata TaxID=106549 RepID=A0A540KQ18_MALBA|nr:hypothetical protein C1H46_038149 [Malus baccata]
MAEPEPFVLHINPSAVPQLIHSAHEPAAFEQFVLQIGQSTAALPAVQIKPSDSAPPPPQPPPHHGTGILNLKVVEPILLHINSLSPPTPPPPPAVNKFSPSTPSPPPADNLPPTTTTTTNNNNKPRRKVLSAAGSLANLLPTGTVLAFQAVTPSLSFNGRCQEFNKYLVAFVILVSSVICFVSSFTDSLKGKDDRVYYGIATSKGLRVLNNSEIEEREPLERERLEEELEKLKVKNRDFLHAFLSMFLFLIFAFSSSEVQGCYFPESRELGYSLATYLPLVAGLLATFLFTMLPTKRRGIGYNY